MLLPEDGEKYQPHCGKLRMAHTPSGTNIVAAQQAVTIVPSGVSVIDIAASIGSTD
jgi:hypothetical protein